jgi:glycosyltransferase involved in cell wall biosynthesis
VATDYWTPSEEATGSDFFLYAGRLVPYKRPDLAIQAANQAGVRLVVAGSGPELKDLQNVASSHTEFVPNPSNETLRSLYQRARALLFPGIEDFGMTMVEAQASGTPVIAYAEGGALEIVQAGVTGVLYRESSPEALATILRGFEKESFSRDDMRRNALRFDTSQFDAKITRIVDSVVNESVGVAATDEFAERLQKDLDVERE